MLTNAIAYPGRGASRLAIALMGGAAALSFPGLAWAQDGAEPEASKDDATGLGDIVVTAQRREQSLSKVPVSIQALSDDALKVQVIVDTPSLVNASPSVGFTSGFSANSSGFIIRGISSASSEGGVQQSTAMVLDGVPLARPGEFLSDLGDIERVEILRGPQGTLFGKNATAGVVSIITKRPTRDFEGQIQAGATTDEEYSARGTLNLPAGDNVAFRFNGFYKHLDPLVKNLGVGGDDYGYEMYGFSGKMLTDISDVVSFLLTADYRNGKSTFGQGIPFVPSTGIGAAQIAVLGYTPRPNLILLNVNGKHIDKTEGYSFTGELGWDVSDTIKVTSISGYRDYKNDNVNDVDSTPAGTQQGIGFAPNPTNYPVEAVTATLPRQPQHVTYFSQELRLNYSGDRLNAVGGFFYQSLRDRGAGSTPFVFDGAFILRNPALAGVKFYSGTQVKYKIKDDTWAAFGDITYKLSDTVSVFGGLRYTHESIQDNDFQSATFFNTVNNPAGGVFFNAVTGVNSAPPVATRRFSLGSTTDNLSGRAGVQFQPTPEQNYYASYNRGYKGPAVDVSRGAGAPDPATGYTPVLDPETAYSFELGTKQQLFDRRVQMNLNLFYEKISNLQQSLVLPDTTTRLFNAGGVETYGVEFDGRARVAEGLTLDAAVTYNHAQYNGDVFVGCYPGQTAALGCVTVPGTASTKGENINGLEARFAYKWRGNVGFTYENDLASLPFGLTFRASYAYFSKTNYQPSSDPLLRRPSHGLLDASVSFTDDDGRWELQFFGKNLTDELYYVQISNVDNVISRLHGNVPRDYKAYGGVRATFNF